MNYNILCEAILKSIPLELLAEAASPEEVEQAINYINEISPKFDRTHLGRTFNISSKSDIFARFLKSDMVQLWDFFKNSRHDAMMLYGKGTSFRGSNRTILDDTKLIAYALLAKNKHGWGSFDEIIEHEQSKGILRPNPEKSIINFLQKY